MKFYCTAGRGTETFLGKELKDMFKHKLHQVIVTDGKVYFELTDGKDEVKKILELKTAERAFVQVLSIKTNELDHRNLMWSIKTTLNNKEAWNDSVAVLDMLQSTGKVDNCGENVKPTDMHECKSVMENAGESVCKKQRLDEEDSHEPVSFRVNFKCPACFRKRLDIKSVPRQIGMHIKHLMGWKVDLRHPCVEICIQLNEELLIVGCPLTREPLSKRSFIKMIGLRSTVAHIMTELLKIQPGDTVLDPMCGKATILLEAEHCFKNARYIGIDKSESQLQMARQNIKFAEADDIQLINGDTTDLPFSDGSMDKIVTDAPFGNTHTTDIPLEDFYTKILIEFSRVLIPSGKLVILTSTAMKNFITKILMTSSTSPSVLSTSLLTSSTTPSVANVDKTKSTCNSEHEHTFKKEKNYESDLHEKSVSCKCEADTDLIEDMGKTNANSNSKVNVESSEVANPIDVIDRKQEGYNKEADKEPQNPNSDKSTKSIAQEENINVDGNKSGSDSVTIFVRGFTNDTTELDTDIAMKANPVSTLSSSTLDLETRKGSIINVSCQDKRTHDGISDLDKNDTRTSDEINMFHYNDTRKDTKTNVLDQNMPTGHAVTTVIHKETRIEIKGKLIENAAGKTNIKDCKEIFLASDSRCKDESISAETRDVEKIQKLKDMILLESHYVKLGETHAYICVLEKCEIK